MTAPEVRPPARPAGPELLVLAKWEEFVGWLLNAAAKWPKASRFTLTQRIENHALDVVESLVVARYERQGRRERLRAVNLALERMRFLLRIGVEARAVPRTTFESAVTRIDEVGRMLHGWRTTLDGGAEQDARRPADDAAGAVR